MKIYIRECLYDDGTVYDVAAFATLELATMAIAEVSPEPNENGKRVWSTAKPQAFVCTAKIWEVEINRD